MLTLRKQHGVMWTHDYVMWMDALALTLYMDTNRLHWLAHDLKLILINDADPTLQPSQGRNALAADR